MSSSPHNGSRTSSSVSSENDVMAHRALASSFAALPARCSTGESIEDSKGSAGLTNGASGHSAKAKSGQLKDFLDLATPDSARTNGAGVTEISSRLEQKRFEHERQKELQKRAFEEQMRLLEIQQQREERELMQQTSKEAAPSEASPATANLARTSNGPTRSRSGNDLAAYVHAGSAGDPTAGQDERRPVGKRTEYGSAAKSMPSSRRHSGEEERRAKPGRDGEGPMLNAFTFDDELDADLQNSAWGGKYLQMNTDDDKFPILIRRDSYPGILSASSAALDLAPLSQAAAQRAAEGRPHASEWPQFTSRMNDLPTSQQLPTERHRSVTHGTAPESNSSSDRERQSPRVLRAPTGAGQLPPPRSSLGGNGPTGSGRSSPIVEKKLGSALDGALPKQGLGKGFLNSELAQLSGSGGGYVDTMTDQFSKFNIDTAGFGHDSSKNGAFGAYSHERGTFSYDNSPGPYGTIGAKSALYGVNATHATAESNRFAGLRLEDLQGDMLPLCKDQFGCRYLQKKLEDGNAEHRDMIFNEIFPHFSELMTDPFANYLAQRLLEYATDEQRDALIESISGELVSISLNMHGTRAVQKMIDYLSTQRQVQSLILALNLNVVTLIKDLNGNHVVQKCLNHLPPEDNQFIYNAVASHCVEVATHRHGCCVLQRCIDHASESQRIQLVTEITYNSLALVQDAFGNYVVQYVLDLNDNRFIEAIVRQFLGNVINLSAQKFSSNVVEKCIRVADAAGRRALIDELLSKQRLERLLRDSFANYVVQTALDYAEPVQRAQLVETIRPILPMIRNTPYGKRIQSKIQRETSDHMSRSNYHHNNLVQGGHFYDMSAMPPPPPQYIQHPGHHMSQIPGDFGARSPYHPGPHMGSTPHHHPGPHMGSTPHHHPNGSLSGSHQFSSFSGVPPMGAPEYQSNGYAPFM